MTKMHILIVCQNTRRHVLSQITLQLHFKKYLLKILHVLSLLYVEQVFAFHGLFQQCTILQHQSLDLVQQMAILLL